MATRALNRIVQHLQHRALQHAAANLLDGELLEGYIRRRDQAAFEALVRRHGPMVLGVCRRILRNEADAEDAFQATFLILARKAGSIRQKGTVANWLYGVAHNTALKARAINRRRRSKEFAAGNMAAPKTSEETWRQVQGLVDGELSLLPEKYRIPIVLCELEGRTIKEAAAHLGWPDGTVATRLRHGRELLARRLARHGLALSGTVLASVMAANAATARVPATLLGSTLRVAHLVGAAQPLLTGGISTKVITLAEGVLKAMLLANLKKVTAFLIMVAVLGIGLGGMARSAGSSGDDPGPAAQNTRHESRDSQDSPRGQRWVIRSEVDGIIADVLKAGDMVQPGTTLVRLDDRRAKIHLNQARSRLEAAKADMAVTSAQVQFATLQAERLQELVNLKAIEAGVYKEALAKRDRALADLAVKKAMVKVVETEVENAQLHLSKFILRSPARGTVRTVFKQKGELVKAGERILEISSKQERDAGKRQDMIDDFKARIDRLEADVATWKDRAAWSQRMSKLGFVGEKQAQADLDRLEKAASELERARKSQVSRPSASVGDALVGRFRYRIPVEMGYTEFSHGGRLEILEVWGTRPQIEVGGQYLVHGKYAIPLQDEGVLNFYLTSTSPNSQGADLDLQHMAVKRGQGHFTLVHAMSWPGSLHVELMVSDRGRPVRIANVYFGTGANVLRKRP
jgi:RNA polymerase sigma factor (sigma-70 family)